MKSCRRRRGDPRGVRPDGQPARGGRACRLLARYGRPVRPAARAARSPLDDRSGVTRSLDPYLAKLEEWVERSTGGSAPTSSTTSCAPSASTAQSGRPAVRWPRSSARTRPVTGASSGPGSPSPACGSSSTGARVPGSAAATRCCGAPGSPGAGSGSIIPTWDRTMPTVIACLDETLRRFGGAPTYALTDNERTVTIDRVAGIGVRHPILVAAGPPLWPDHPRLRAGRPGVQGRIGEHGQDRQGRPRPDRGEPAARIRLVRRSPGRLRRVLRARSTPESTARPTGCRSSCLVEERAGSTRCPTSHTRSPSA